LAIAFLLVALDLAQHGAEPLVGDDRCLCDVRAVVEVDTIGQPLPGVTDLDASVLMLVNTAAVASESERLGPGLDEVDDALVVQRQVPRELALLLPGEDQVEVLVRPRSVGVRREGFEVRSRNARCSP
jgi:hypothetical protein